MKFLKTLKLSLFSICISHISIAEIPLPIIEFEGDYIAPIHIEDGTIFAINSNNELKSFSNIKIDKNLENLTKRNQKAYEHKKYVISDNVSRRGNDLNQNTNVKATAEGIFDVYRRGNDLNQNTNYFVSQLKNPEYVISIINADVEDLWQPKRLELLPFKETMRIRDPESYNRYYPLENNNGSPEMRIVEVTYEVYRKNITVSDKYKHYTTPYCIEAHSRHDSQTLRKLDKFNTFKNFGPFITTENTWIKEKFYAVDYPDIYINHLNVVSTHYKGFTAIKNIRYNPLLPKEIINLYTMEDIKNYNVFAGKFKREQKVLNNGELLIKSLETNSSQTIKIRGATPPNRYKIKVDITFKGGELVVPRPVSTAKEYKFSRNINEDGYNVITYTYIDGLVDEHRDDIINLKLASNEELKIKDFSITAKKIIK